MQSTDMGKFAKASGSASTSVPRAARAGANEGNKAFMRSGRVSLFISLPLLGEGWDGGTHDAGTVSALAPTLTLPRKGREL